jgi:hypothetical protein
MDFIELFYLLFQLKIIEAVQPTSLSFVCKDGIDVSMPAVIELFFVLKLLNNRLLSKEEEEYVKLLLYGPSLLVRGRALLLERFTRMNTLIKLVEQLAVQHGQKEFHQEVLKKLCPLYDRDIVGSILSIPKPLL